MRLGFSCNLNQRNDVFLITTNADKTARQSEFVTETCIWYKARENTRKKSDNRYARENACKTCDLKGDLKGPGKRGHIVADTLLPTQMCPRLPACTTFVADTNFVSGTQKVFLILFRNILCPQEMFPVCARKETS